jgi:hypothetical protein
VEDSNAVEESNMIDESLRFNFTGQIAKLTVDLAPSGP